MFDCNDMTSLKYQPGCQFNRRYVDRITLGDRLKLCDVPDVSKEAACGTVLPGRLGRVGRSADHTYAMPHNFMRSANVLLN